MTTENEQPKSAEEISKQVPWELQIIRNIWRGAYINSEEDHVKILKDYGDFRESSAQQRIKELESTLAIVQRFRLTDTANALYEANDLRQRIKELEEELARWESGERNYEQ